MCPPLFFQKTIIIGELSRATFHNWKSDYSNRQVIVPTCSVVVSVDTENRDCNDAFTQLSRTDLDAAALPEPP